MRSGSPRRSPHKIRKTYASILLDNNVAPKLIIETMGHTDISTTNGSYARRRKTAKQRQQVIDSIPEFACLYERCADETEMTAESLLTGRHSGSGA